MARHLSLIHISQAIDNQTRYTSLSASRGQIFDRNMNVLASSKTVETVFIDPNEIAQEMAKPENSNLLDHIARGLSAVSYTHLDVYKRQQGVQGRMQARSKYGAKRPKAGKKK